MLTSLQSVLFKRLLFRLFVVVVLGLKHQLTNLLCFSEVLWHVLVMERNSVLRKVRRNDPSFRLHIFFNPAQITYTHEHTATTCTCASARARAHTHTPTNTHMHISREERVPVDKLLRIKAHLQCNTKAQKQPKIFFLTSVKR